jgi:hypothetical protein
VGAVGEDTGASDLGGGGEACSPLDVVGSASGTNGGAPLVADGGADKRVTLLM